MCVNTIVQHSSRGGVAGDASHSKLNHRFPAAYLCEKAHDVGDLLWVDEAIDRLHQGSDACVVLDLRA